MSTISPATYVKNYNIGAAATTKRIQVAERSFHVLLEVHWAAMKPYDRIGAVLDGQHLTLFGSNYLGGDLSSGQEKTTIPLLNEDITQVTMPCGFLNESVTACLKKAKDGVILLVKAEKIGKFLNTTMMVYYDVVDKNNGGRFGILLINA